MSHTEQMREARKIADEIDANVLAVANRQMKPGAFPLDVVCKAASLLRTLTAPAAEVPKQSTRLRAAAVPEGWKLVPVEPPRAMMEAGEALPPIVDSDMRLRRLGWSLMACQNRRRYLAMLQAAPQAPAAALDAGVVRDAERYMGLTEAHDAIDAAMSAQAGNGGAA